MSWRLILTNLFLAVILTSFGVDDCDVSVAQDKIELTDYFTVNSRYSDSSDIALITTDTNWSAPPANGLFFGVTDKGKWLRVTINNPTTANIHKVLHFAYGFQREILVYEKKSAGLSLIRAIGTKYPAKNNDFASRSFAVNVDFQESSSTTLYLYLNNDGRFLRNNISLYNSDYLIKRNAEDQFKLGVWFGVLGLALLASFLLYYFNKQPSIIFYFLMVFGTLCFNMTELGVFYEVMDGDPNNFLFDLNHVFALLPVQALLFFVNSILNVKRYFQRLFVSLNILFIMAWIGQALFLIPAMRVPSFISVQTGMVLTAVSLTFVSTLVMTGVLAYRKVEHARLIFGIYILYIGSVFVSVIMPNLGLLDSEGDLYNFMLLGSSFEVVIFLSYLVLKLAAVYREREVLLVRIENAHEELLKIEVSSKKKEREAMADELYDNIGAKLLAINVLQKYDVKKASQHLEQVIEEIKLYSKDYISPKIIQSGFEHSMGKYIELVSMFGTAKIKSEIDVTEKINNSKIGIDIFKVVQDIVNGIVKHGERCSVSVQVVQLSSELVVRVSDNSKQSFNYLNSIAIQDKIKSRLEEYQYSTSLSGEENEFGFELEVRLDLKSVGPTIIA